MGSAGVGSAPSVHSGWGIDALLGAQPRTNVILLDSAGREIDLHPACFAANGDGIYRMKTGEDWPFPAAGFAGQGRLLDRAVRCLTPEVEVLCHTDDEFGAYGLDVPVAWNLGGTTVATGNSFAAPPAPQRPDPEIVANPGGSRPGLTSTW